MDELTDQFGTLAAASPRYSIRSHAELNSLKKIVKKIKAPVTKKDLKLGSVYVAKEENSLYSKIGFSKYEEGQRIKAIRKCKRDVEKAFQTPPFFGAHRAEQLTHLWHEDSGHLTVACACGKQNKEWYKMKFETAIASVHTLYSWMLKEPYGKHSQERKLRPEWIRALTFWLDTQSSTSPMELIEFFLMGPTFNPFPRVLNFARSLQGSNRKHNLVNAMKDAVQAANYIGKGAVHGGGGSCAKNNECSNVDFRPSSGILTSQSSDYIRQRLSMWSSPDCVSDFPEEDSIYATPAQSPPMLPSLAGSRVDSIFPPNAEREMGISITNLWALRADAEDYDADCDLDCVCSAARVVDLEATNSGNESSDVPQNKNEEPVRYDFLRGLLDSFSSLQLDATNDGDEPRPPEVPLEPRSCSPEATPQPNDNISQLKSNFHLFQLGKIHHQQFCHDVSETLPQFRSEPGIARKCGTLENPHIISDDEGEETSSGSLPLTFHSKLWAHVQFSFMPPPSDVVIQASCTPVADRQPASSYVLNNASLEADDSPSRRGQAPATRFEQIINTTNRLDINTASTNEDPGTHSMVSTMPPFVFGERAQLKSATAFWETEN